ncbi:MAG: POTRA domain-containing protein, partial [Gemmatimonadota bacterium]
MRLRLLPLLLATALSGAVNVLAAQEPVTPPILDSISVLGNARLSRSQIIGTAGLAAGQVVGFRDVQRALASLFRTGQFDDVRADYQTPEGKFVLVLTVKERPLVRKVIVRSGQEMGDLDLAGLNASNTSRSSGRTALSIGGAVDKIKAMIGRPIDRAGLAKAVGSIDSLYSSSGYSSVDVKAREVPMPDGSVQLIVEISEGNRVAVSQIVIEGNTRFSDKDLVSHMATRPEGFWWWQKGRYEDSRLDGDVRERLPNFYGQRGYIDFQVRSDTLQVDSATGKAVLQVNVEEGKPYFVGTFEINGNRYFSRDELLLLYPFGLPRAPGETRDTTLREAPFNRIEWDAALAKVETLYHNNGYIYVSVTPTETRRLGPDGQPRIDLTWEIHEGSVATINKVNIVGNDVTHERVIREAIVLLPGDVFSQDRLIRSYQNIANLGFFQQPMPFPDIDPTTNGVDVDVTFRVEERRTGNFNFGASLGQGTGVGGFFGIEEPNLFGRGKRIRFQWQFGR